MSRSCRTTPILAFSRVSGVDDNNFGFYEIMCFEFIIIWSHYFKFKPKIFLYILKNLLSRLLHSN